MLLNLTIQCLMNVEVLLPIPSFPLPSLPFHLFPFLSFPALFNVFLKFNNYV